MQPSSIDVRKEFMKNFQNDEINSFHLKDGGTKSDDGVCISLNSKNFNIEWIKDINESLLD